MSKAESGSVIYLLVFLKESKSIKVMLKETRMQGQIRFLKEFSVR
jgi:hypothetical protein